MDTAIQNESRGQQSGWLTGLVGGLLLISLGFELLAQQVFGHTDVGTLLWALYWGFWSFILGTIGCLLLAAQWVINWRHVARNKKLVSVPGGFSQALLNSRAMNHNRENGEPCTQAHEPETAVTCS